MSQLYKLQTETSNEKTRNLDTMNSLEILQAMNEADQEVVRKVNAELSSIVIAVDIVKERLKKGGRLIYAGAGTSGRLGVLDASECPPTFGVSELMVQGVMAGGLQALTTPVEGAEDNEQQGMEDIKDRGLCAADILFAISASGRTPYCAGALKYARSVGAATIALSCNKNAELSQWADAAIEIETGPEVLSGSTRLKAGTATKLVLNMITTASMVQLGKVYKNYMVEMLASNEKLRERAKRIVMQATGIADVKQAEDLLEKADGNMKLAIIMELAGVDSVAADRLLTDNDGFVSRALNAHLNL